MGLDMNLYGRKYHWHNWDHPEQDRKEDGFRVSNIELELAYWRKHPDLHGYIVQAFADGKDECQEIELTAQDIRNIISAVKGDHLPQTSGFFFGVSDNSKKQRDEDVAIFERALAWLEAGERPKKVMQEVEGGPLAKLGEVGMTAYKVDPAAVPRSRVSRSVIYRASW